MTKSEKLKPATPKPEKPKPEKLKPATPEPESFDAEKAEMAARMAELEKSVLEKAEMVVAKNAEIAELKKSVLEKAEMVVAKNAEIAELKKQVMVMRNVMNSPSPMNREEKAGEKPDGARRDSVYPRLFDTLFDTVAKVVSGGVGLEQAAEIRQCCKLASDISETQNRVILSTRAAQPRERVGFEKVKRRRVYGANNDSNNDDV